MKPEERKKTSRSLSFGVALTFLVLAGLAVLGESSGSRTAESPAQRKAEASPTGLNERASDPIRADDSDQVTRLPGHSELDLQLD